jgi:hypothetical protein
MDADFSIELGADDPVLDFPWSDPAGNLFYVDLKRHPEQIDKVTEASLYPELAEFLQTVNSRISILETAKCDAWATEELSVEGEIYGAAHKFASYVDLVFAKGDERKSFAAHEQFARNLVSLLNKAPELPSAIEIVIRRCIFQDGYEGMYFTAYASGYGPDDSHARRQWAVALGLLANALLQLSAHELRSASS